MRRQAEFYIYTRGSSDEGLGHLMRCTEVARELRACGTSVKFVIDGDAYAINFARHLGAIPLTGTDLEEVPDRSHWIVDATHISAPMEARLQQAQDVVLLSPIFNRPDLISRAYLRIPLNEQYDTLSGPCHVGRTWSVVRNPVPRTMPYDRTDNLAIGICLSGGKQPQLKSVLDMLAHDLSELGTVREVVVAPGASPVSDEAQMSHNLAGKSFTVICEGQDVWASLTNVDLLICGDGIVVDEACLHGIATVVFTTEQNLWKVAELAQADAVLVATSIEQLQDNVVRLIQAPDRRSKMAHAARHLIDGMGAKRLAAAITGLTYSKS